MSRRSFYTMYKKRPIEVTLGYDSSLLGDGYFLDIEYNDILEEDEDNSKTFLYSSLYDQEITWPYSYLDYFLRKINNFGIKIPKRMIQDLERDEQLVKEGKKDIVMKTNQFYTLFS